MRADRILIVDDDDALRRMLVDYLGSQGYTALGVRSVQQGEEALRTDTFDLVIADLRLEDGSGLDLLKQLKQIAPRTFGILMTGYATMETAVEAIRIGLFDYMIKPIVPAQLDLVLQRLESMKQLQSENSYLRQQVQADGEGSGVVWGKSGLMQDILEMVKKVAQTHATVLIQGGERHGQGSCRSRDRAAQHAGPDAVHQSELRRGAGDIAGKRIFWHEKGAFTVRCHGARAASKRRTAGRCCSMKSRKFH